MRMRRTGDWRRATAIVAALTNDLNEARKISLMRIGLYAEARAKKHMTAQDLNWKPLKARTIVQKVRLGQSTKTLIASGFYLISITSWVDGDRALVGVKRNATNRNGQKVADIARVHEFGSVLRNIPARPLWQPVLKETVKAAANKDKLNPVKVYIEYVNRKYGLI